METTTYANQSVDLVDEAEVFCGDTIGDVPCSTCPVDGHPVVQHLLRLLAVVLQPVPDPQPEGAGPFQLESFPHGVLEPVDETLQHQLLLGVVHCFKPFSLLLHQLLAQVLHVNGVGLDQLALLGHDQQLQVVDALHLRPEVAEEVVQVFLEGRRGGHRHWYPVGLPGGEGLGGVEVAVVEEGVGPYLEDVHDVALRLLLPGQLPHEGVQLGCGFLLQQVPYFLLVHDSVQILRMPPDYWVDNRCIEARDDIKQEHWITQLAIQMLGLKQLIYTNRQGYFSAI